MPDLPQPSTMAGRAGLAAVRGDLSRALVGLDFDGTLSPIVSRPADSRPADGAVEALTGLAARARVVAVVTGRPVRDVVGFLGLDRIAGLDSVVVAGHYGLERWTGGRVQAPDPEPGVQIARGRLPTLLADAPSGVTVEDKRHALVVHTRAAPDPAGTLRRLAPALRRLATESGLDAAAGRYVLELRPPGVDKGAALRRLVREYDARAVLFAGDDLGDLPAFDAVLSLRADGVPGVTVCSGSDEVPEVRSRADLVVDGPVGVVALLQALIQRDA